MLLDRHKIKLMKIYEDKICVSQTNAFISKQLTFIIPTPVRNTDGQWEEGTRISDQPERRTRPAESQSRCHFTRAVSQWEARALSSLASDVVFVNRLVNLTTARPPTITQLAVNWIRCSNLRKRYKTADQPPQAFWKLSKTTAPMLIDSYSLDASRYII